VVFLLVFGLLFAGTYSQSSHDFPFFPFDFDPVLFFKPDG
jgi:hypothetical protein